MSNNPLRATRRSWVAPVVLVAAVTFPSAPVSLLSQPPEAVETALDGTPVELEGPTDLGVLKNGSLVGFSPDGRTLATAGEDTWVHVGPIRLWNVRTGEERTPVAPGWKQLGTIRFSPDGRLLAAYDKQQGMGVWDARTGKLVGSFRPATRCENWVHFFFSPDSRALIYEHYGDRFPDDSRFNVRDIGADRDRASFTGEPWMIGFSPDGKRIATGTTAPTHDHRDRVLLYAWEAGRPVKLLKEYALKASQAAFAPDLGAYATTGAAEDDPEVTEIRVVSMETGQERLRITYRDSETHIQKIAFGPGGRFLVASGGGGTQLTWKTRSTVWHITASKARELGTYPTDPVFSPDGRFLAVREESRVSLQEIGTGNQVARLTHPDDVTSSFFGSYNNHRSYPSVTFSPDGRLLIVGDLHHRDGRRHGYARLFQVEPVRELAVLESCRQVMFSPDGRAFAVLTSTGELKVWQIRQGP